MKNKNTPDRIKKALLQLGFTEKEIAAYVALLELGASSVQDISRKTNVNRVSIYDAIDELKAKGLVSESRKGKKKLFVAEDPDRIMELVRIKKTKLQEEEHGLQNTILPILKAINIRQENKPQIKFFDGLEGIYKVYDDYILNSPDVIGCGSYDSVMKVSAWKVEKKYIEEMRKKKILFRGILEDTETNREFDEISRGVMHNKFLPMDEKVSADILVFGSMVALISYEKKSATLIEDESIAVSIRMYLEFMWDRL